MNDEPGFTSSQNPKLSALRIIDEPQFIKIISIALARHRGVVLKAAPGLKVHRNTLMRWIDKYPALQTELQRIRIAYATEST